MKKMLSSAQINVFCDSIAMMLQAGVPLSQAVAMFAQDAAGALGTAAGAITAALEEGESFAAAAEQTGAFPPFALGVFRTAELSGRLDEALERLAEEYDRENRLTQRLRTTLSYPAALLLMMCGVLAVLVFGVLPMFQGVYNSITGSLAASSYAYVLAAAAVGRVSLVLCALVSAVLVALCLMTRGEEGRKKLRGPMERFYLTRDASRLLALSRLTDTLATLLASGTDPDEAIDMAREVTEHSGLKAALDHCREQMDQGLGLASALVQGKLLPTLYGRMLLGGNESGRLAETLEDLSRRLGREAEESLCAVMDRTEPVLIGFLTLSVGLTLLGVMLPLLGILGAV